MVEGEIICLDGYLSYYEFSLGIDLFTIHYSPGIFIYRIMNDLNLGYT